jgi:hypothetical protein
MELDPPVSRLDDDGAVLDLDRVLVAEPLEVGERGVCDLPCRVGESDEAVLGPHGVTLAGDVGRRA